MTSIENAFIGYVGGSNIQTPHEAQITDISGNTVRYIAKGMWSGGLSGITLKITAIGI
jgi:hypothetical protein